MIKIHILITARVGVKVLLSSLWRLVVSRCAIYSMEVRDVKVLLLWRLVVLKCCYLQHEDSWCQGVAICSVKTCGVKVLLSSLRRLVVSRCCYLQHGDSLCQGVAIYNMENHGVNVLLSTA